MSNRRLIDLLLELEDARRSREHTETWYAVRFARLKDWVTELSEDKQREFYSILANATSSPTEPPTYAQQMNLLRNQLFEEREARAREVRSWRPSSSAPYLQDVQVITHKDDIVTAYRTDEDVWMLQNPNGPDLPLNDVVEHWSVLPRVHKELL